MTSHKEKHVGGNLSKIRTIVLGCSPLAITHTHPLYMSDSGWPQCKEEDWRYNTSLLQEATHKRNAEEVHKHHSACSLVDNAVHLHKERLANESKSSNPGLRFSLPLAQGYTPQHWLLTSCTQRTPSRGNQIRLLCDQGGHRKQNAVDQNPSHGEQAQCPPKALRLLQPHIFRRRVLILAAHSRWPKAHKSCHLLGESHHQVARRLIEEGGTDCTVPRTPCS